MAQTRGECGHMHAQRTSDDACPETQRLDRHGGIGHGPALGGGTTETGNVIMPILMPMRPCLRMSMHCLTATKTAFGSQPPHGAEWGSILEHIHLLRQLGDTPRDPPCALHHQRDRWSRCRPARRQAATVRGRPQSRQTLTGSGPPRVDRTEVESPASSPDSAPPIFEGVSRFEGVTGN